MDFDSIPAGVDFREHIKQTLDHSDLVVAVIGSRWLGENGDGSRRIDDTDDFVRLEIEHALKRGIPVIPLLVNNASMPKPDRLPPEIAQLAFRNALPLDAGRDFHHHADRLLSGIDQALCHSGTAPALGEGRSSNVVNPLYESSVMKVDVERFSPALSKTKYRMLLLIAAIGLLIAAGVSFLGFVRLGGKSPLSAPLSIIQNSGSSPPIGSKPSDVSRSPILNTVALYIGQVYVENDPDSSPRPIAIALDSDHRSGTMTQTSKRGDFVVKFTGVWDESELRAVTGDVVSQPLGIIWTPESFTLRFAKDGKSGSYECTADGKTYLADLVASAPSK